ncbi:hypothetical protein HZS_4807 [Henneguya salminicola]|nr:hypothetical protein HZS_4807 [Henneguya salminicola]
MRCFHSLNLMLSLILTGDISPDISDLTDIIPLQKSYKHVILASGIFQSSQTQYYTDDSKKSYPTIGEKMNAYQEFTKEFDIPVTEPELSKINPLKKKYNDPSDMTVFLIDSNKTIEQIRL